MSMTAQQLASFEHQGDFELDEGELIPRHPAGSRHGAIAFELGRRLGNFAARRRLGQVFAAETGFRLSGETVRGADVSFVRAERLTASEAAEDGFFPGAPDLAVEVLSPRDYEHPGQVLRKVSQYLEAGSTLVWIVDARERKVAVYRPGSSVEVLSAAQKLAGDPVLPGFSCRVRDIFP